MRPGLVLIKLVLIADDNLELGEMLKIALQNAGYTILLVVNGEEALKTSRRMFGKIDLLLTDFDMPGMNGVELARMFA